MSGRRRVSRRAFLGLSAAVGLALSQLPAGRPRLAAVYPLTPALHLIPDALTLAGQAARFDAVLLPAYAVVSLIQAGAVRPWAGGGPGGQPHDPAGTYTWPAMIAALAVVDRGPAPAWRDVFEPGTVWPADARLALAGALLGLDGMPDDRHPGRWAQAQAAARAARPIWAADPLAAVRANRGVRALALVDALNPPPAARFPPGRRLLVELDWVAPPAAHRAPEAALRQQPAAVWPAGSALTLGPMTPAETVRLRNWWRAVRGVAAV